MRRRARQAATITLVQTLTHEPAHGVPTSNLGSTKITDAGLKELAHLEGLATLLLHDTGATNAAIKYLARPKGLTALNLTGAGVTGAGIKELQKALPNRRITR